MSWRDRIFLAIPVPETVPLMVLGFLILAAPFLIPLLLLVLLGLALFKWRPWLGCCYTAVTVVLLVWGVAWVQQRYDPLKLREFRRVVLDKPAPVIRRPATRASSANRKCRHVISGTTLTP